MSSFATVKSRYSGMSLALGVSPHQEKKKTTKRNGWRMASALQAWGRRVSHLVSCSFAAFPGAPLSHRLWVWPADPFRPAIPHSTWLMVFSWVWLFLHLMKTLEGKPNSGREINF